MKRIFNLMIVMVVVLGFSVIAQAALIDRGGGLIYDDDLNITWLSDANYAMTSGYSADGRMTWSDAMTWADTLVYGGFDDWRLPSALNQDGSGPCVHYNCIGSEMGHLYYTELGNISYVATDGTSPQPGSGLTNTGGFLNLQPGFYWSGTVGYAVDPSPWSFHFNLGYQNTYGMVSNIYALAVRPGDVSVGGGNGNASVPEPSTLLLLGSGLAGMAAFRKKLGRRLG